jgi:hypothetical protein
LIHILRLANVDTASSVAVAVAVASGDQKIHSRAAAFGPASEVPESRTRTREPLPGPVDDLRWQRR